MCFSAFISIPRIDIRLMTSPVFNTPEVVSKPQIAFESKAQADEKVVVLSIHGSM
jgi:hypothetical protein